jgi:hypothetical protein
VTTEATEFFSQAAEEFCALALGGGTTSHYLRVAGLNLRLEIAKGLFERLMCRALAHLTIAPFDVPDLTIFAWDSETTGVPPLRPGWTAGDYGDYGLIKGFNTRRYHTAVQSNPTILRMLDRTEKRAIYWTPDARQMPHWEVGAPLRPLLHDWLLGVGKLPVHGGAVGYPDGGLLLAGPGGTGKSNTALACLNSDLLYASDDFCVLADEGGWQVYSLYCTGKIAAGDLARHPHLTPYVANVGSLDREKALLFVNEFSPAKIIRNMPLRAIVMPKRDKSSASKLLEESAGVAQRAVAMSTIELSQWTAAATFSEVARLIRALPHYQLRISEDMTAVPKLLSGLLNRLKVRTSAEHA